MASVKGQNVRILIGTSESNLKCVAVAQQCVMHIAAQVGETTSKDSQNEWAEQEITAINWDVQVDALMTLTADSGAVLVSGLTVGESYVVRLSQTSGANNRTQVTNSLRLTGNAILSELTLVASNHDQSTWSAKFTGDGAITQYN